MKTICFCFQIHQPFRLKRYRFFDIGNDHYYYDDFNNEDIIRDIATKSYLPANQVLLEMIKATEGRFKVAFSISGVALEQLEMYVPEFIDSMREMIDTGCVEILSETYSHSLASLAEPEEFEQQVKFHSDKVFNLFGVRPTVFKNTELIYSDDVAEVVAQMGFKGVITEGAKHILGWKSPNYVYDSTAHPDLKVLLRNSKLSDDLGQNFSRYDWSEYPLTADKFVSWIASLPQEEKVINLFMNYEVLGKIQPAESGIFDFFKAIPYYAEQKNINFSTPSQVIASHESAGVFSVVSPISGADEERDVSAWLGNNLQKDAFGRLYQVAERVRICADKRLLQDWDYLQCSDHFYYMSTKRMSDGAVHTLFSPYDGPYDAFTNYMNVLADFLIRLEQQYPDTIDNEELKGLLTTIKNQGEEIKKLEEKVKRLTVKSTPKTKRTSSNSKMVE